MMKRLLVLVVFLSGCTTPVPDSPVCVEMSPTEGRCVTIVSGQAFIINESHLYEKQTWWDIRNQMILVPASSWADIKKFILDICKATNKCQQGVGTWQQSLQVIDTGLDAKGGQLP